MLFNTENMVSHIFHDFFLFVLYANEYAYLHHSDVVGISYKLFMSLIVANSFTITQLVPLFPE